MYYTTTVLAAVVCVLWATVPLKRLSRCHRRERQGLGQPEGLAPGRGTGGEGTALAQHLLRLLLIGHKILRLRVARCAEQET